MIESSQKKYQAAVFPGNNPKVIEKALKTRNVWHIIPHDKQIINASFIWKNLNFTHKTLNDIEQRLKLVCPSPIVLNHFEHNNVICTKSGLLKTLKYYYSHELALSGRKVHIHDVIPTSFIIKANKDDTEYKDFVQKFNQLERKKFYKEKVPEKHCLKNVWFIKPQSDNQGKGIILSNNFKQIETFLINKPVNSGWVVQKAIQKPLLYQGRKFDIRVWVLVTPQQQIFYYNCPYMRTSSSIYTTDNLNAEVHLTNNCQQKHFGQYSKYQEGNTLQLETTLIPYLQSLPQFADNAEAVFKGVIENIKGLIIDTLMSAKKYFSRGGKRKQFQLFGYDFLLDEDVRVWLLQVNNNPYLGMPNPFIKDILPKMINEMFEIVLDTQFPPQNYTPVEEKLFVLIHKEVSMFRLQPIRMASSSNQNKTSSRKLSYSFSRTKPSKTEKFEKASSKVGLIDIDKEGKGPKPVYSTPTETIKYLLDNYCFNDVEPFITPVQLILNSSAISDQQSIDVNIKKIKLITESRIAKILLQPKIFELCTNIINQDRYPQKVKACILLGFTNACKNFKARIFLMKNLMPIISQNIWMYRNPVDDAVIQASIKLLVVIGGYFDRSIFIPGQSRENQLARQMFIRSNSLKLLLYFQKKHSQLCQAQISKLLNNLSEKDWDLFYECSGNKNKRCYSPKVNTTPNQEAQTIMIHSVVLRDDKPKPSTCQATQLKKFRMRRHSGFSPK